MTEMSNNLGFHRSDIRDDSRTEHEQEPSRNTEEHDGHAQLVYVLRPLETQADSETGVAVSPGHPGLTIPETLVARTAVRLTTLNKLLKVARIRD
jgi:hypothetical protein